MYISLDILFKTSVTGVIFSFGVLFRMVTDYGELSCAIHAGECMVTAQFCVLAPTVQGVPELVDRSPLSALQARPSYLLVADFRSF